MRSDQVMNKATVEGITGNRHAIGAENIFVTLPPRPRPRAELDQAKVTRAAAKVGNKHQVVVVALPLVLIRGADRLKLDLDLRESCQPKGSTQTFERGGILA